MPPSPSGRLPRAGPGDAPRKGTGPPLRRQDCCASLRDGPAGAGLERRSLYGPSGRKYGQAPACPTQGAARPVTPCPAPPMTRERKTTHDEPLGLDQAGGSQIRRVPPGTAAARPVRRRSPAPRPGRRLRPDRDGLGGPFTGGPAAARRVGGAKTLPKLGQRTRAGAVGGDFHPAIQHLDEPGPRGRPCAGQFFRPPAGSEGWRRDYR
jgi:hypothetical protein